jgi:hypothetical protein
MMVMVMADQNELQKQGMFKMMTMLISDLGEHEGTIYKHG